MLGILAEVAEPSIPEWIIVACAALGAIALVLLFIVSARGLAATRALAREARNAAVEMHRWSEIAQRQTELNNSPLLKVVGVEETSTDQGRGTRIDVKNVGFGSAVNVKCTLTNADNQEYAFPQTELIGNETATFEPPILVETVKSIRLEYVSQGGSYAHTTQYVMKSGGQSYALHRVR
jgi:hypothetical protein